MSIFKTLFGSSTQQTGTIQELSPKDFKAQIEKKNVQLIDVRSAGEFKSGHIKRSKNIDFFSGKFSEEFSKLDKEKAVYLYCRSGSRSKQSSKKLAAMGFDHVYDLKGGILNYN